MNASKVIGCTRRDGGADCYSNSSCVGCSNAIYEEPRGLRKLIAALQVELEKNGDAEHVVLGLCISHGTYPRRIDIHSPISVLSDWTNYPNGFVYLVADSDLQIATPPARDCNTTHHLACDCREHKVAVLIKAALDGAAALDDLREAAFGDPHAAPIDAETNDLLQQVVSRAYAACEALGVQIGAPCECASCGKVEVMA